MESCEITLETWFGQLAEQRLLNGKLFEYFLLTRESEEKYCSWGTKVGKVCYKRDGN